MSTDIERLREIIARAPALVLKFSAEWCRPCRIVAPLVRKCASEHKDVQVLALDIEEDDKIAEYFNVTAVPTFLFFRSGKKEATVVGTDPNAIRNGFRSVSSAYPMSHP